MESKWKQKDSDSESKLTNLYVKMGNYTSKYHLFRVEPKENCSPHGQEQWQKSVWKVQPLDTSTERAGETQKGKNHLRDS